jgi:hypothetical protein
MVNYTRVNPNFNELKRPHAHHATNVFNQRYSPATLFPCRFYPFTEKLSARFKNVFKNKY